MTRISKKQFQENTNTKFENIQHTENTPKLKMVEKLSGFIQIHFYILENLSRYYINTLYRDISNLYIELSYLRFEIVVNHTEHYTMEHLQNTLEKLNQTRQQIFDKYSRILSEETNDETQLFSPLPTPR
jgi:adenine-specific DNA methylase